MVEVLVALVIIGTGLVVMAATMYSAFGSITFSRQRNTATALANKAMEQIRALPFTQLNMNSADFVGDGAITAMTCPPGRGLVTCYGYNGRLIPTVTFPANQRGVPPLDPHIWTQTPAPSVSTYTTSTYITYDANQDAVNRVATVIVSWDKPGQGGQRLSVQIESTIFASSFTGAPANVSVTTATVTPGVISLVGKILGSQTVNINMNLDSALAQVGGSVGAGGATAAGGTAASSATVLDQDLASTPGGTASATSTAGSPVSPTNPPATVTRTPSPWAGVTTPVSGIAGLANISITPSVWNTTSGAATAASSAQNSLNVPGAPTATIGYSQLPYSAASASATGAASVGLNLVNLLNIPVFTVTPTGNSAPDVATVDQEAIPVSKITASASKSFGAINVLTLPGLTGGRASIVSLTGWKASATAVGVPGAQTAIASTTTNVGTLTVLGSVIDLGTVGATATSIPIRTRTPLGLLGALGDLNVTGTVTVGGQSSTTAGNGRATVSSPVNVQLHISAVLLNLPVIDLDLAIDLGSVAASAVYPS